MDEDAQRFIVSMNTHEQLGEDGIDANSLSLGEYAPFTIDFRTSKGLQVSHIDFHVTGDYWRSWKVEVLDNEIIIHVDEERFNELVHDLNFSPDHVGLTDINTDRLAELIKNKYLEYAKSAIFL